jgi:molybdate transport system substrate-binding protein
LKPHYLLVFLLFALGGQAQGANCRLLIAAASDLAHLEDAMRSALKDCDVRFSFASSGTLARQIRYGADFDVFLSASRSFVDSVVREGAADGSTVTPYAYGRLAFWSRRGLTWQNLRGAGVKHLAIANPGHAPYGVAAKQALIHQGLWSGLESRIVLGESVRQAFQFAATGNVDAAIVAWSLVFRRGGELLDAGWHAPLEQVAVVVKAGKNQQQARSFLGWLTGSKGQQLLQSSGFEPVGKR